jgi:hypothetical protein
VVDQTRPNSALGARGGGPSPGWPTEIDVRGLGHRRTELHSQMTAPNADAMDAVVAPERHLRVDRLGWARWWSAVGIARWGYLNLGH